MSSELKGYIFSILYGLACLFLAVIVHKFGVPKKYCRKIVHILVGFEWLILYTFMGASIHFLIVCLLFTALLLVTYLKKMLPMISSDGDNAPGTVYYGVAMSIMAFITIFVPDMILPFGIGVFCTSFGDGFAGVVGQSIKKYNPKVFKNKTLFGVLANFALSFAVAFVFTKVYGMGLSVWQCLLIAFLSAQLELIGVFGLDNIFITLGTAFLSYAFINLPVVEEFLAPIILTPFVIILVIQRKALTRKGLIVALGLDLVVSLSLRNFGFVLLLSFLVASILIDKVKRFSKKKDTITKKGDCRDEIQVIANGLIPMALAILYACTYHPMFIVAYVAALAEAFADTAASGIGIFSKRTVDIFKFKRCESGLSGGMSVIGTLASLVAAALFVMLAIPFGIKNPFVLLIAAASAFLGVIFDSFLGSIFQVKYKCSVCSALTEREEHCDKPTEVYSGFRFFDNDVVNVSSGLFSGIVAILMYSLFI